MEQKESIKQQYLRIIDHNDLAVFRQFSLNFAEQIAKFEYHSLRAVEQSISILTGLAVRYCQLMRNNNCSNALCPNHPLTDLWRVRTEHEEFMSGLDIFKRKILGGRGGIELAQVQYHGRQFIIRALFCGPLPHSFDEPRPYNNDLAGPILFSIFEGGRQVGGLSIMRVFPDLDPSFEGTFPLGDVSKDGDNIATQILSGGSIVASDSKDSLLGHFLHQLLIEIYINNELESDLEINHMAYDQSVAVDNGLDVLNDNNGEEIFINNEELVREYFLSRDQLSQPKVYFNGADERTSWQSLIDENPIISNPAQFLWPQFCGLVLPSELDQFTFNNVSVDMAAPINCMNLLVLGRSGVGDTVLASKKTMFVHQASLNSVLCLDELDHRLLMAKLQTRLNDSAESLLQFTEEVFRIDNTGELCCTILGCYLEFRSHYNDESDDFGPALVYFKQDSEGEATFKLSSFAADVFYIFCAAEEVNPRSEVIQVCKKYLEGLMRRGDDLMFKDILSSGVSK